jgi:Sel1 repeat
LLHRGGAARNYNEGVGVPQDYAQALMWYSKAADQGVATAKSNIGLMYANGQGMPQDYGQALIWLRKAADHGDAAAQNNLGLLYENGQGVPEDYRRADMWFNLAASRAEDTETRDFAVKNRDVLAVKRLYFALMKLPPFAPNAIITVRSPKNQKRVNTGGWINFELYPPFGRSVSVGEHNDVAKAHGFVGRSQHEHLCWDAAHRFISISLPDGEAVPIGATVPTEEFIREIEARLKN